jgi:cytosine/adenosine deaminase-related metal-dependent hydrolase
VTDSTSILLRNATIVTMNPAGDVIDGDVLIRDGEIVAIGEVEGQRADGAEVIDVGGQALIPGFVQTHIHLCQTLMRNLADDMVLIDWLQKRIWPYEAALEFDELYASAELGLSELILGGTTTLLDMGTVRHTDAVAEAVKTGHTKFDRLAVTSAARDGVTPCGMCRQTLSEFANEDLEIVCDLGDETATYTLGELLPNTISEGTLDAASQQGADQ